MSVTTGSSAPARAPTGGGGSFRQKVNDAMQSLIGRVVAGIVVPVVLPLATSLAYGIQKWLHFKLTGGALAGYLGTIAGGIAITAYKWLENRGAWERAVLDVAHVYETGEDPTG